MKKNQDECVRMCAESGWVWERKRSLSFVTLFAKLLTIIISAMSCVRSFYYLIFALFRSFCNLSLVRIAHCLCVCAFFSISARSSFTFLSFLFANGNTFFALNSIVGAAIISSHFCVRRVSAHSWNIWGAHGKRENEQIVSVVIMLIAKLCRECDSRIPMAILNRRWIAVCCFICLLPLHTDFAIQ